MGKFLAKLKRDEAMLRGEKADFLFTSPSPGVNYLFGKKGGIKPGYSTLIYGPPKCLKYDTLIVNPQTGIPITFQEAFEKKIKEVYSYNEETGKVELCQVNAWIDSGIKPIVKLTTRLGTQIETTQEHLYLTFSGWKMAGELQIGEKIAVPKQMPFFGKEEMSAERCFILASLIADGGLTCNHLSWTKKDPDIRHRMIESVKSEFDLDYRVDSSNPLTLHFTNGHGNKQNPLLDWVRELGIDVLSKNKTIPKIVFSLNKKSLAAFISALWSGDGSVDDGDLEYTSASEKLTLQVQHLLLRFGIVAKKANRTSFYYDDKEDKREFPSYRLTIAQDDLVVKFYNEFKLTGDKQKRLQDYVDGLPDDFVKRDYLTSFPKEMWNSIKEACSAQNMTLSDVYRDLHPDLKLDNEGRLPRYKFKTQGNVSISTLERINDILQNKELNHWVNADIGFVEIAEKEMLAPAQCYDLTVPKTHNFIANDIVAHNSGKSLFAFAFAGQLHQNDPEAIVMYFDTEYRDNAETWYKPFGIDPNRFISRQTNDPVQIFDYIVNEVKAALQEGEKIKMIIIDSLAMIRFPKEANKELSTDMVIGDGAAYLTGAMKLIIPTIRQNNIALILCQHVRMNMNPQTAKYHPYIIPGGIALKHSVEYWLYCEKINGKDSKTFDSDKKDGSGNPIQTGHAIRVKMEENSFGPQNRAIEVDLSYTKGLINQHVEIATLAVNMGIIERPNNVSYVLGDEKWHGYASFEDAVRDDQDMQKELLQKIKDSDLS